MAEGKLNINAPLMSVRRSTATSPSLTESKKKILAKRHTLASYYKSDLASDQMTETVTVPFNWERVPGRCKGNIRSEPQLPAKDSSITPSPRLPPGKSIKPMEKESKVANKSKSFNVDIDRERERKTEKVENYRWSTVEEEDDVYSDALETLSHTESFSMNCSVSGISGLDNFDSKKFGTISTDQQTRDFMMSRFLPAAKAMTLQPSQYSSKKQSGILVEQQPRDVNKLIQNAKKPLVNNHITDIIPYTGQCQEEESEDKEDEDAGNDYDNSASISAKGCGLLPNLHIRNSLCLLNPVAGVKMKNQITLPSVCDVGKPPNKSSHIRSFSPVPAVKKAWEAIHRNNKSSSGAASPEMQVVRKKKSSESNRFAYSGELLSLPGRLSPFRRSRAAATGVSPSRSKPQSPFRGAKFLGDTKEAAENNKSGHLKFYSTELGKFHGLPFQGAKRSAYSGSLATEKTLYIDTVITVKSSSSNLSSVDNRRRIDTVIADMDKRRGKESNSSIESSNDIKHEPALEEKTTLDSEVLSSIGGNSSTLSGMLHLIAKEYEDEVLTNDQLQQVQGTIAEDSDNENNKQIVLAESAVSPLPPPLPKSPSESWLWRAMPISSVKNSFMHSNQGTKAHAKRHGANTTSNSVKWETIVKTSNSHHDHVRYSQELTTGKSQYSKS